MTVDTFCIVLFLVAVAWEVGIELQYRADKKKRGEQP